MSTIQSTSTLTNEQNQQLESLISMVKITNEQNQQLESLISMVKMRSKVTTSTTPVDNLKQELMKPMLDMLDSMNESYIRGLVQDNLKNGCDKDTAVSDAAKEVTSMMVHGYMLLNSPDYWTLFKEKLQEKLLQEKLLQEKLINLAADHSEK